jgi:hypothetical protein
MAGVGGGRDRPSATTPMRSGAESLGWPNVVIMPCLLVKVNRRSVAPAHARPSRGRHGLACRSSQWGSCWLSMGPTRYVGSGFSRIGCRGSGFSRICPSRGTGTFRATTRVASCIRGIRLQPDSPLARDRHVSGDHEGRLVHSWDPASAGFAPRAGQARVGRPRGSPRAFVGSGFSRICPARGTGTCRATTRVASCIRGIRLQPDLPLARDRRVSGDHEGRLVHSWDPASAGFARRGDRRTWLGDHKGRLVHSWDPASAGFIPSRFGPSAGPRSLTIPLHPNRRDHEEGFMLSADAAEAILKRATFRPPRAASR